MNPLACQFYEKGDFLSVDHLSQDQHLKWEQISEKVPELPRAWFELSRVSSEERIEFVQDFWLDLLPLNFSAHPLISNFFSQLDDICIIITRGEEEVHPEMVYSFADNSTFFRGLPPANEEDIRRFIQAIEVRIPSDYRTFLRIHNGFGKFSELGVLKLENIMEAREQVRGILSGAESPIKQGDRLVNPESLIPFYEVFGMSSFQCFYSDWYPESDVGNVYLSGIDYTISDVSDRRAWQENLAFSTFSEWLGFYLEGMNLPH